jgi:dTDP-4-amino-4,6-dideoxygalactose transaminase
LSVPLLDLRLQHEPIREELLAAAVRVIDSQAFVLGQEVARFEEEMAQYCGARFAVGCASGSDALMLALAACGLEPGDRVLTTPFSFFATAGYIVHAGGTPVFCDIDPVTYNLDPAQMVEAARGHSGIQVVMPVHLYGGAADLDPIGEIARRHGWRVIEDGAQSVGAEYKGRRTQGIGDAGCISFYPTKNLSAWGDGGMVTTNSEEVAGRLRSLRVHGSSARYYHESVGWNSRLDAVQAAVLRVKLRYLDGWTQRRQQHASLYRELLQGTPVKVATPAAYQTRHVWNQFVVRAPRRDELRAFLASEGIGSEIYYPLPLHLQKCFAGLGYREGDFPESEKAAREVLALPIQPELGGEAIERVAEAIRTFYGC